MKSRPSKATRNCAREARKPRAFFFFGAREKSTPAKDVGMQRTQIWRVILAGVLAAGTGVLGACDRKAAPAGAAAGEVATYTTRGKVEAIVRHPGATPMVKVHHEAIAEFKDRRGTVIGMKEMVMEFPAGPGVSFDGLKVGDLVRIEFAVDWNKTPYHYATAITTLPAGTALTLGTFEDAAGKK